MPLDFAGSCTMIKRPPFHFCPFSWGNHVSGDNNVIIIQSTVPASLSELRLPGPQKEVGIMITIMARRGTCCESLNKMLQVTLRPAALPLLWVHKQLFFHINLWDTFWKCNWFSLCRLFSSLITIKQLKDRSIREQRLLKTAFPGLKKPQKQAG